jgi:hypothetical protein
MPVTAITIQPVTNKLLAAYRPVLLAFSAIQAPALATNYIPPVAYCDVYVGGVYYRSMMATQPANTPAFGGVNPMFQFDIQDILQEVLQKVLPTYNGQSLQSIPTAMAQVYCRFRASSIDSNGFTVAEGPVPVQRTGKNPAIAGGGTQSNTFIVINATLQESDNQDLETHLSGYKTGTWSPDAYPLTHRPAKSHIGACDSSSFPVIYKGTNTLKCIRINYKIKGASTFTQAQHCFCAPVSIGNSPGTLSGVIGVPFSLSIPLSGDAPYSITFTGPPGISAAVVGAAVNITGTPTTTGAFAVNLTVTNCSGTGSSNYTAPFTVTATAGCVPVSVRLYSLPQAIINQAYSYTIPLLGDPPFLLDANITKPGWMSIQITGSNLQFTGTPTQAAVAAQVSLSVSNCSGANNITISGTVAVSSGIVITGQTIFSFGSPTGSGSITGPAGATATVTISATGAPGGTWQLSTAITGAAVTGSTSVTNGQTTYTFIIPPSGSVTWNGTFTGPSSAGSGSITVL